MIDGIGIADYRSFGQEVQLLGPLQRVNLIIGQNNSGKSNVLRFLVDHYNGLVEAIRGAKNYSGFKAPDQHLGKGSGSRRVWLGRSLAGDRHRKWLESIRQRLSQRGVSHYPVDKLLDSRALRQGTQLAWFEYEAPHGSPYGFSSGFVTEMASALYKSDWVSLRAGINPRVSGGSLEGHVIPDVLRCLSPANEPIPQIAFVPAIRQISGLEQSDDSDYSGKGLIHRLARLQNPSNSEQHLKERFNAVNDLLRSVTGSENATLEIPYKRDTILVHMNGKTLPLEALGTGIHEVVILASAATVLSQYAVCIEEPEIHLHPVLQRKFLRYLEAKTDNQYFFATHSAHLLEHAGAGISHIRLINGASKVNSVTDHKGKSRICLDLGYRASDIMQANCVIWVEGPSDRVYLNRWIGAREPRLAEGTHYSIMFYGGRLLSHLSGNDPEIDGFISLRRLNRFIAILIDSDRRKPREHLNATKRRVVKEFDRGPGFAWVTSGREIENYLHSESLEEAVRAVHSKVLSVPQTRKHSMALRYTTTEGKKRRADKMKVATYISQLEADYSVLDLHEKMNKTIRFIEEANGA